MRTGGRLRRPLLALLVATAAAGGMGVAVALPTAAATDASAITGPTVSAYTVPGSATTDSLAIAPVEAGTAGLPPDGTITSAPEEWILDSATPQVSGNVASGGPELFGVSSVPSAPTRVQSQSLGGAVYDGVNAAASNRGNSLIDVAGDAVGVQNGELYNISEPAGEAIGSEFSDGGSGDVDAHAGVGMSQGSLNGSGYVFTSDGTRTADACATEGSGCTALPLPSRWTASGIDGLADDPVAASVFTDSNDELGVLGTDGAVTGPWDTGHVSPLADAVAAYHPIFDVSAANPSGGFIGAADTWFAWESTANGTADELAYVADADPGAPPTIYGPAQGMPANADITALTVTSDGNVMFCDAANNAIGELDVSSGTITETPLPSGFLLPTTVGAVEPDESGTDDAYFYAQSGAGLAVGEVQGDAPEVTGTPAPPATAATTSDTVPTATATTTTATDTTPSTTTTTATTGTGSGATAPTRAPVPTAPVNHPVALVLGRLALGKTAAVSKLGLATLRLSCSGGPCIGTLSLTATVRETVRKHVRGRAEKVTETRTVTFATVPFILAAGTSRTDQFRLTPGGLHALEAATGTKLISRGTMISIERTTSTAEVELVGTRAARTRRL